MPLRPLIERYYAACNDADADRLRSCFTDDAVHYFTRLPPVRGADALAQTWRDLSTRLRATWTVEHCIEEGDEACIEWTMTWTPEGSDEPRIDRGSEWYVFDGEQISEIRAYHHSGPGNRSGDLIGFDHAGRGHTTLAGA